jgi:hypothetical protein
MFPKRLMLFIHFFRKSSNYKELFLKIQQISCQSPYNLDDSQTAKTNRQLAGIHPSANPDTQRLRNK